MEALIWIFQMAAGVIGVIGIMTLGQWYERARLGEGFVGWPKWFAVMLGSALLLSVSV